MARHECPLHPSPAFEPLEPKLLLNGGGEPAGVFEAYLERTVDYDAAGAVVDRGYCLGLSGYELTDVQLATPWGEDFLLTDLLPGGAWPATFYDYAQGSLSFIAATEPDGEQWFEASWTLDAAQWAALDTTASQWSVSYTGDTWDGSLDFSSVTQPPRPLITAPTADQTGLAFYPTFQWDAWSPAAAAGSIAVDIDVAGQAGPEAYGSPRLPATATAHTLLRPLAPETQYRGEVGFGDNDRVDVGGVDVDVVAYSDSEVFFTTGAERIINFSKTTKAIYNNGNVTVALTGPGSGEVHVPAVGNGDAREIILNGTTEKSSLSITTKGTNNRTFVGDIIVNGSLGSLTGKTTNLGGNVTVSGGLATLTLADVTGPTEINLHTDAGITVLATLQATFSFGRVADANITSGGIPIKSLTAIDWSSPERNDMLILAPSLGTLTVKGRPGTTRTPRIPGDFDVDLTLDGANMPKLTLGTAKIDGTVHGTTWDITGNAGTVTVGVETERWTLNVHSDVGSLKLGQVDGASVTVAGNLGTVTALCWQGGDLAAKTLKSLQITGRKGSTFLHTSDIPGDFDATLSLTGNPAVKQALAGATIAGTLTGETTVEGNAGSLAIGHLAGNLTINGDVTNLKVKDYLALLPPAGGPTGQLAITGKATVVSGCETIKLTAAMGQVVLYPTTADMYRLEDDLRLYNHLGTSWDYQVKNADGVMPDQVTILSAVQSVGGYDCHVAAFPLDVGSDISTAWFVGVDGALYMTGLDTPLPEDAHVSVTNSAAICVVPALVGPGKKYTALGPFSGELTFDNDGSLVTGTYTGTTTVTTRVIGHEKVSLASIAGRTVAGDWLTVKGETSVALAGTIAFEMDGKAYKGTLSITTKQTWWVVPGLGIMQDVATASARVSVPRLTADTQSTAGTLSLMDYLLTDTVAPRLPTT
ncbi:MAG: hypothetical protein NTU94_10935 [Planctomycetota bacterium]|nr:hypothetical protein [Planctomycetota bacterium]